MLGERALSGNTLDLKSPSIKSLICYFAAIGTASYFLSLIHKCEMKEVMQPILQSNCKDLKKKKHVCRKSNPGPDTQKSRQ